jgi:hypothetical protein
MKLSIGNIFGSFFVVCAVLISFTIVNRTLLTSRMRPVQGILAVAPGEGHKDISYVYGMFGTSRANSYNITLRYYYVVNRVEHQGKLIGLNGNSFASEKVADGIIEKYINSDKVTVWYDPKNPDFAVLEKPSVDNRLWRMLFLSLAVAYLCNRFLERVILKMQRFGKNIPGGHA